MKKILILILLIITLNSCEDNSSNSTTDNFYYDGITNTLKTGEIISIDSLDWLPAIKIIGNDTFLLKPFPAFPNPLTSNSFAYSFEINRPAVVNSYLTELVVNSPKNKIVEDTIIHNFVYQNEYSKGNHFDDYQTEKLKSLQTGIYRLHIIAKMYTNENHTDSVLLKSFGDIQIVK